MERVRCSCTVEDLGGMTYEVEVWGEEPHAHTRVYTIKATSDNLAAQDGLRQFVEEMECLHDAEMKDE
jgi:hypothetical protein